MPIGGKIEEVLTKFCVTAKVKNIRKDFTKAYDDGKKGVGRIVFAFYSLCQGLWGIMPAVNTISNGIDLQDSPF